MTTRRQFLAGGVALVGATLAERASAAPDIQSRASTETASPLWLSSGKPYQPVVTPNGWTLAPTLKNGVKEFHLVAEAVKREFAPGMTVNCWGYNGGTPGPTLEAVEGERVRIYVTNKLPEHTSIHWHGMRVPNGMDGVGGLTQPHIPPGKTFVYEFVLKRSGTFMYHPHSDDMLQTAMGMMGFFIVHPKNSKEHPVDRDFCIMLHNWDVEAGTATPKASTMTEFNLWSFNSRVFPGTAPMAVRRNDRVRIRIGNLSMHDHPIHLHGYDFWTTGTDGGWVPKTAQVPEITINVPVGAMRAIEFVADEPGDCLPLPQDAPCNECDGAWHSQYAWRRSKRDCRQNRQAGGWLHGDGGKRHVGNAGNANAAAGKHAADDDWRRAVRLTGNGRHVHGGQSARWIGA